jgi:peptidoglycan L-alanyl-D-glutamate endopeptidase CwlK
MIDDRSERHLARVHPELAQRARRVLSAMAVLGFPMTITDGNRTVDEQRALYAKGRTAPGAIVTNADGVRSKSNHQDGRAIDCAFIGADGNPHWRDDAPWRAYGECAKALGLKWGGDFKSLKGGDRPHIELPK